MIGSYLIIPALTHGLAGTFAHMAATDPRMQSLTPAQRQNVEALQEKIIGFGWVFAFVGVPFAAFVGAIVLLIFDKIGRGEGSFAKYWAAACNIGVPALALSSIVSAIIVLIRGADSFGTTLDVQQALPTLAMLTPAAPAKLTAFLAAITPFTLWGAGLNVAALRIIGKVAALPAWLGALTLLLVPAIIASLGPR